jgi:hypothetical protein
LHPDVTEQDVEFVCQQLKGALSAGIGLWAVRGPMSEFIIQDLSLQRDLALGRGGLDQSLSNLAESNFKSYWQHVADHPFTLLFGDGFSGYRAIGPIGQCFLGNLHCQLFPVNAIAQ